LKNVFIVFIIIYYLSDFYAKWCGPCQLMSPILEDFANMYGEKVNLKNREHIVSCPHLLKYFLKVAVAKVDTDKYPLLGSKYNIEGLPTCVLFKNGKEVIFVIRLLLILVCTFDYVYLCVISLFQFLFFFRFLFPCSIKDAIFYPFFFFNRLNA